MPPSEGNVVRARQGFFGRSLVPMAVATLDGELADANRALARMLNIAPADLIGRSLRSLTHPDDAGALARALVQVGASADRVTWVGRSQARPGAWHTVRWALAVDPLSDLLLVAAEDLTSADFATRQLVEQAQSDPLTGLGNRRLLDRALHRTVSGRPDASALVMVVDLDGLKGVNDAHGHRAGDAVLRDVATRLRERTRPTDVVVRIGGDEFAVVTPAAPMDRHGTASAARLIGGEVVDALAVPHDRDGRAIVVTGSVGVAAWPWSGGTPEALLAAADVAMYRSKRRAPGSLALCEELVGD
jgi:diguanylate cyclase (GGDEF)-like protein/PAS domain S-box-containing protein